jgi:hypothetical protein
VNDDLRFVVISKIHVWLALPANDAMAVSVWFSKNRLISALPLHSRERWAFFA